MDNSSYSEFLSRIALLLELKGDNPYKIRSYNNASRVIDSLENEVGDLIESGELIKLKGIGKGISENIFQFMERGSSDFFDQLENDVPEGLVEMTKIRGLGPSKVRKLYESLEISSLVELEYACIENRLIELKGFGDKTQSKILKELTLYKQYYSLFHLHYASSAVQLVASYLDADKNTVSTGVSGDVRRSIEVISSGALAVITKDYDSTLETLKNIEELSQVEIKDERRVKAVFNLAFPIRIHIINAVDYPLCLFYSTGSKKHLEDLENHASAKGFSLSEAGLQKSGKEIPLDTEQEIYTAVGLPFIEPELREGMGEVEAAEENRLPALVNNKEIEGVLHVHTEYSDGKNSILEMAQAVKDRGFKYLGITDHSRTASYAGGLSIEKLEKQGEEIKLLNSKLSGLTILHGVESDILKDGSLDYPDEVLAKLDFVIASVHSSFQMDIESMTERITQAIQNRYTRILGHPTGRLLLGRGPYEVDMERIIQACAKNGVAIELNANPHRLDVDWRLLRRCTDLGVRISINPDAHRIDMLDDLKFGIGTARKGWLEKKDILNSLPLDELLDLWR